MQKFDFIKSLFIPQKMVKFKYMSILISICIFVLSSYLLAIPARPYINRNIDKMIENDNYLYLQALTKLPVENDENCRKVFEDLQNLECQADETSNLVCNNMGTYVNDEGEEVPQVLYKTSLEYVREDGIKINFTIVVDLFNEKGEINYNPNVEFAFPSDKFSDANNTEYYLLVFWKDSLYYQANPFNIASASIKHDDKTLTTSSQKVFFMNLRKNGEFRLMGFTDPRDMRDYLVDQIKIGHVPNFVGQYSMSTFIFTVIFTLIVSLIFWLCFRRSGRLKTFKEYYNIAAISSIIPTIVIFGLMWIELNLVSYYIFIFSVYYLFVLYRINNSAKIA